MPVITLTPGQFTKKFPKGEYKNYLKYLSAHVRRPRLSRQDERGAR